MKILRPLFAFACALASLIAGAQTWTPLNHQPPFNATNQLLLTDGTVLAQDVMTNNWWKLTPDITGSYVNGTWTQMASMPASYGPLYYASGVAADGRVFVMGGEYNNGSQSFTNQGAIYDPVANSWTTLNAPPGWSNIGDAQSLFLPDGRWIIANPLDQETAILNVNTLAWTVNNGATKIDRNDEEGWTLLPDGNIFAVNCANIGTAEKYSVSGGNWFQVAPVPVQLPDATSEEMGPQVLMPNGKVFCFGATGHNAIWTPGPLSTDPGKWTIAPDFPVDPNTSEFYDIADGAACLLPSGNILCGTSPGVYNSPSLFFEYDGTNLNAVSNPPTAPTSPSFVYEMLMLPSGQVLLTSQSGDVEIYSPTGTPQLGWRPTITNMPSNITAGNTYQITGTQFNGLSFGASYGDDAQDATNYPIVRITNIATGHVFYARTFGHTSMGVATGGLSVTTNFVPPLNMEDGASTIEVIANGIPSGALSITAHAILTKSVSVSPTAVTAGNTDTGTVTLNVPAPNGGITVNLSSNSPSAVVPSTLFIPGNQTSATFNITTSNNTYSSINATITLTYLSEPQHQCVLKVQPNNRAQFVSQNTPTAMIAGQSYPISIVFKNLGTTTWDFSTHQFELGSANPYNNNIWGMNRMPLQSTTVAPNANGNFAATVFAPMTAGTYNFQWQPFEGSDGTFFGQTTTNVVVTVTKAADAARYISRTGGTTVSCGQDFFVQNTMKNVGTNTWTNAAGYHMVSVNPYANTTWTIKNLFMPANSSIAPGAQVTFTGQCTAPISPGTYTMQWSTDKNGVTFGDRSPLLTITVNLGPDDSQFISSTMPASMGPGVVMSATITMKNLGGATWDSTYSLVSTGGNNFNVASIPVTGTVAPNTTTAFTATFTAPASPGTYTWQMRMQHNTTKFGQPTPLVSVVVGADAAQYLSRTGPTVVNAGQDFYIQNTMKNTGTTTWTGPTGYTMMTVNPNNDAKWTATRAFLPANASIAPGASGTFTVLCTAPITPGTYSMQWQTDKSGTPFGEKSPLLNITVNLGADDAQFISQTGIPTTIVHGQTFNATITMKNLGTATWTGPTYSLKSIGSNTFGIASISAVSTAQNANDAFNATFTAPATPGTYTFQIRMQDGTTMFGQAGTKVTITVT